MISNLIVVALGLATPALPATIEEPQPATEAKGEAADAKKICRRITATGTRLPKRYCRTKAEWDTEAEAVKRELRTGPSNAMRSEPIAPGPR